MAFAIFTPPRQPSVNSGGTSTRARRIAPRFGDGYSQRVGDGLNNTPATAQISWTALSYADTETIMAFFLTHAGGTAFLYRLPNETMARTWVWTETQRSPSFSIADTLSVTLEEVFDLA